MPEVDAEYVAGLATEWAVEKEIVSTSCPPPYDEEGCEFSFNPAEIAQASEQNPNNRTLSDQLDIKPNQVATIENDTEENPCR